MKSERAIRRALKRWERLRSSDYSAKYDAGWLDALAWVLDYGTDPTLKSNDASLHKV